MSSSSEDKSDLKGSALFNELRHERERTKSLKLKQLKALKLLKARKKKLLQYQKAYQAQKQKLVKYQRAYKSLKQKSLPTTDTGSLEHANAALKADLQRAEDRLIKTMSLFSATKAELTTVKKEFQAQAKDSAPDLESLAELKRAQDAVASLEEKREQESRQLTEALLKIEALEAEANTSLQKGVEIDPKIAELEELVAASEAECESLQSSLDQVKSQLASREAEHEEALLKLWDLEEKIQDQGSEVDGALEAQKVEIEEAKKKILELTERVAVEESEKEKALARLNESRDEATRLEDERDALVKELDESKERIGILMSAGQNLKVQMADLTAKFESLQQEHEVLIERAKILRDDNASLMQKVSDESSGAYAIPAPQRAAIAEARLKEVEEQLVDTRSRLLSFHNQIAGVEQKKEVAQTRIGELESELEYKASQMQQLEDLVSLLEQKEETHTRQLAAMRRQITELLEDNGRMKEEISEKTGRLKHVQRSFEETDESLNNIRRRYDTTREALELNKGQLIEARNRALMNLTRAEEADKKFSQADREAKMVAEENKVLKRRMERLQERVAELEMLS